MHRGRRLRRRWLRGAAVGVTALATLTSLTAMAPADPAPARDREVHRSNTWTDAPEQDRGAARVLRVTQRPQQDPSWDWAAVAQAVTGYYGKTYTQEQLCFAALDMAPHGSCPRNGGRIEDVRQILDRTGLPGSRLLTEGLTFDALKREIDAGRPVVGHVEAVRGTASHTVVAYGYDARRHWVYWADSWPTAARYNWADFDLMTRGNKVFRLTSALVGVGPGLPADRQPPLPTPRHADQDDGLPQGSDRRPTSPSAKLVDIDMRMQEQDEWCWSASGSTIADHWGKDYSQTQFCNLAHGRTLTDDLTDDCPNEPAPLRYDQTAFRTIGMGPGSLKVNGGLTFQQVKTEIDAGRPLLALIGWKSGGGHVQVIFGYDEADEKIYWGDPWMTSNRYNWAPIDYYADNDSFRWLDSVRGITRSR